MVVIFGVILMVLMLGNQVWAARQWGFGGYGKYNLSWEELNEFIRSFNSWNQSLGLTDYAMRELEEEIIIYSIGSAWELSPNWGIEWVTSLVNPTKTSESKEKTIPLEGGGRRSIKAEGEVEYSMVLTDLTGYYFFRPDSKIRPFIKAGLTYWAGAINAWHYTFEEDFNPPWDYEYKQLDKGFSVSDFRLGYILGAGLDGSLGKRIRMGLDLRYQWIPKMECEVDTYNEGFSSPTVSSPIKIDTSGWIGRIYLMIRF